MQHCHIYCYSDIYQYYLMTQTTHTCTILYCHHSLLFVNLLIWQTTRLIVNFLLAKYEQKNTQSVTFNLWHSIRCYGCSSIPVNCTPLIPRQLSSFIGWHCSFRGHTNPNPFIRPSQPLLALEHMIGHGSSVVPSWRHIGKYMAHRNGNRYWLHSTWSKGKYWWISSSTSVCVCWKNLFGKIVWL